MKPATDMGWNWAGRLRQLSRPVLVFLVLSLIIGASMLGASIGFAPRSASPEYLDGLRDRLDVLHGQIAALERIQQLQKELASVNSQIEDLQRRLENTQSQLASARASLLSAQQELVVLRKSLNEATTKVQQLEVELQRQQATLQSYTLSRDQAKTRHEQLLNEYNSRVSVYSARVGTYNQKSNEYDTRWQRFKNDVYACVVIAGAAVFITAILTGGFSLAMVPQALAVCQAFGIDVSKLWNEYNELLQLKNWLENELTWLQSEQQQLQLLKGQLDQATRDLALWNQKVESQQAIVTKTQNDLNYWISRKNQLESQVAEAQTKVDQLTSQVRDLESQEAQTQTSLNSALAKKKQIESSIQNNQDEFNRLQNLINPSSGPQPSIQLTSENVEAALRVARNQAEEVNYEILRVTVQPYLRWSGTALLTAGIASILIAAMGREGLRSIARGGVAMLRRLPVRLRGTRASAQPPVPVEGAKEEAPETPPVKPEVEVSVPLKSTLARRLKPRKRGARKRKRMAPGKRPRWKRG